MPIEFFVCKSEIRKRLEVHNIVVNGTIGSASRK